MYPHLAELGGNAHHLDSRVGALDLVSGLSASVHLRHCGSRLRSVRAPRGLRTSWDTRSSDPGARHSVNEGMNVSAQAWRLQGDQGCPRVLERGESSA